MGLVFENKAEQTKEIIKAVEKSLPTGKDIKEQVVEIQKVMMGSIRDKLFAVQDNGQTYYENYLTKYLAEALADPNSKAGQQLSSGLINEHMFAQMDRIANEQNAKDIDFREYRIRKTLYDKQQEVFDNNIDKHILIINSRRSGKTELMGRLLAKRVCRPKQHCVYINRSAEVAYRQIEAPLMTALKSCGLDSDMKGSVSGGRVDFTNGSWILFVGNNNIRDVDRMRGEKIALCILDECGHQRNIKHLMQEVIDPATIDYADSQIIFVGTPPRVAKTYIAELYNNPNIKKYHWTFMDNPFIPNRENVVKEVCDKYGVSPDSAFIRREYFGDMDAFDQDALVIPNYTIVKDTVVSDLNYNNNEFIPPIDYAWVGVDWGFEDKAAVVSVVCSKKYKRAWIVDVWSESGKTITETANEIKRQRENILNKYHPTRGVWIICDTNDKQGIAELAVTHKIPNVYGAWKYDKDLAIESLKEYFKTQLFTVTKECSNKTDESGNINAVIEDLNSTVWERDEETGQVTRTIDDSIHHPNALMAILYISRQFTVDILGLDPHSSAKEYPITKYGINDDGEFIKGGDSVSNPPRVAGNKIR